MNEGIEITDRYKALGIPYPKLDTMCEGQCEGTGVIPINENEENKAYKTLWNDAHKNCTDECDGWHFIKCPDCKGTGKKTK